MNNVKQQDVSFFWDGDDLVIAVHRAKQNTEITNAVIAALIASGSIQKEDSTAEPVPAKRYPAPKAVQKTEQRKAEPLKTEPAKPEPQTSIRQETRLGPEQASGQASGQKPAQEPAQKPKTGSRAGIAAEVRKALDTMEPSEFLKNDRAFCELAVYWDSKQDFKRTETGHALNLYMTSRFSGVKDAGKYAEELTDKGVNQFLKCFSSAYTADERKLMRKADMTQKRALVKSLILRCQNQKKKDA